MHQIDPNFEAYFDFSRREWDSVFGQQTAAEKGERNASHNAFFFRWVRCIRAHRCLYDDANPRSRLL